MVSTKDSPALVAGLSPTTKGSKKMAKVKVLVGVVASGFDCKAGGEYDLTDEDATMLIRMAKQCQLRRQRKK